MIQDRILHPPYVTDGESDVDIDELLFEIVVHLSSNSPNGMETGEHGYGYFDQRHFYRELNKRKVESSLQTEWMSYRNGQDGPVMDMVNAGLVTICCKRGFMNLMDEIHLTKKGSERPEALADARRSAISERLKAEEEVRLLAWTRAAVEAKAKAEANPDDPLSWLRMAEAMDRAKRPEEAERCRKTAMDLMEKKTL